MTLKEHLSEWTDIDIAQFHLARCLGLMSPEINFSTDAKHIFWTDNPIGNMLAKILDSMTETGILEKRDEPDFQYRWNPELNIFRQSSDE